MVTHSQSDALGSAAAFADDWQQVLASNDPRYLIYPTCESGRQADLLEWIKAQQIDAILAAHAITHGAVLEYGCGAAGISLYLAQHGYNCHLCDLSGHALHVAERNRERHAPHAPIVSASVADGLALPYADQSFDVVMSYGLLEHFAEEPLHQLLTETIRVLKPGGLFLADIVPAAEVLNARTVGLAISYVGSVVAHILRGKWQSVPSLFRQYFDYYYESRYDADAWLTILHEYPLTNIVLDVCRPFPLLALSGTWEQGYTMLLRWAVPLQQRFDHANTWFTRRWGWMYLVHATKLVAPDGQPAADPHPR